MWVRLRPLKHIDYRYNKKINYSTIKNKITIHKYI